VSNFFPVIAEHNRFKKI